MTRPYPLTAVVACMACLVLAGTILALGDVRQAAGGFVAVALAWSVAACAAAWGVGSRSVLPALVVGTAVGLRVLVLATEPTLSDDVFRYLWEGRVLTAGFDPFQLPPDAPELTALRDANWSLVNHRDVSTIYPPAALAIFEAIDRLAPTVFAWKVLATVADLVCLGLLARLCAVRGTGAWAPTIWALHPLPVLEAAGSGHLESLALVPLLGALLLAERRPLWATLAATVGSLLKLLPLVVVAPILLRREWRTRLAGAGLVAVLWVLCLAPYLSAGSALGRGFGRYSEAWAFNGSVFPMLELATGDPHEARLVGVALGGAVCLWALWRRPDPCTWSVWCCGALVLLSPVVHPWYLLWPLAPALAIGAWPWVVLASTVLLSYLVLGSYDPSTSAWVEAWWIPWVEYPPLLAATLAWHRIR